MSDAATTAPPPLAMHLRWRLSVMMFFEFAVWGAWFVLLTNYLAEYDFTLTQVGGVFSAMAIGAIVSPILVGQICDRFFASQVVLGVLHLAGAAVLVWMANSLHSADQFYWVTLLYALLYNPTLALANSVCFAHVPDATRDFPGIRVLGTIGWIVASACYWLLIEEGQSIGNLCLYVAAGLSVVLGLFSFVLPHTPPAKKVGNLIPFLGALKLFKDFSFSVFFICSFLITIVLAFYYVLTGFFLEVNCGVPKGQVGPWMAIGQVAEMILLPFLPVFLHRWGMKGVLVFGMLAWGVRYGLFALGVDADSSQFAWALVIIGIALHGICFDFFFAAAFIHVENEAPASIRASAQALFTFLTYGVGMWIGYWVSGVVADEFTVDDKVQWTQLWLVPAVGVIATLIVFALLFRPRRRVAQLPVGEEATGVA